MHRKISEDGTHYAQAPHLCVAKVKIIEGNK
jgi:hypothetical protein